MSEIVSSVLANPDYFVLLLFRTGGLIFPSPIFGRVNIPAPVKVSFCVCLSYMFFLMFPQRVAFAYGQSLLGFTFLCVCELLLGVVLSYILNLFFTLTFTAGHMIDMQIGFGIVNVYDAQNNTQIPMVGNILNLMLLVTFFSVNGHLRLISILKNTFDALPVGTLVFSATALGLAAMELFVQAFVLAMTVALPIIASGLIIEVCFGVMVRTVPQMNMFVVGIPLKLFAGFLMLLMLMPAFVAFSDTVFNEMFIGVENMFATFLPAS